MRYVLLDFDGVLCTDGTYARWWGAAMPRAWAEPQEAPRSMLFDPLCVERVQRLCDAADASVVLSTNWRYIHGSEECVSLLHEVGLTAPIVGQTPAFFGACRTREISTWLAETKVSLSDVVILDDLALPSFEARHVRTPEPTGMADYHLALALWKFDLGPHPDAPNTHGDDGARCRCGQPWPCVDGTR